MELPIKEPVKERLLRRVDMQFVASLKKRMLDDDSGIGIPPLAVICKSIVTENSFETRLRKVYTLRYNHM